MHCDARLASRHTHYSIVFFFSLNLILFVLVPFTQSVRGALFVPLVSFPSWNDGQEEFGSINKMSIRHDPDWPFSLRLQVRPIFSLPLFMDYYPSVPALVPLSQWSTSKIITEASPPRRFSSNGDDAKRAAQMLLQKWYRASGSTGLGRGVATRFSGNQAITPT